MRIAGKEVSTRTLVIIAASVLALVAVVVLALPTEDGSSRFASLLGAGAENVEGGADSADGLADGSSRDTAQEGDEGGAGGSGSGGSGDSASGGSGNGNNGGSGSGSGGSGSNGGSGSGSAMGIMILYWNETGSRAPGAVEVEIEGAGTFKPTARNDSDTGIIRGVPIGEDLTMVVYPDGRPGNAIRVPIRLEDYMEPESARDGVHIEISDTWVRVIGNPVDNLEQTYQR